MFRNPVPGFLRVSGFFIFKKILSFPSLLDEDQKEEENVYASCVVIVVFVVGVEYKQRSVREPSHPKLGFPFDSTRGFSYSMATNSPLQRAMAAKGKGKGKKLQDRSIVS